MNNLCEDIDSLYNTKSTMRLNYLDEDDEFGSIELDNDIDEDDEHEGMYFKCDCVYSNCSRSKATNNSNAVSMRSKIENDKFVSKKFKITHNNKALTASATLFNKRKNFCNLSHKKSIKKSCL